MSYSTNASRYQMADILDYSPEWRVPLVYEHVLLNLNRAAVQIEMGDLEGKAATLSKASHLLMELMAALDHSHPEVERLADDLAALYAFFITEIQDISRRPEPARIQQLSGLIKELHESWAQAAEQLAPRTTVQAAAVA